MSVVASRFRQAEKVCSGIERHGVDCVVFVDRKGHLDCFPAGSPRHQAMAESPAWSSRIVGVYRPSVTVPEILADAAEVPG